MPATNGTDSGLCMEFLRRPSFLDTLHLRLASLMNLTEDDLMNIHENLKMQRSTFHMAWPSAHLGR